MLLWRFMPTILVKRELSCHKNAPTYTLGLNESVNAFEKLLPFNENEIQFLTSLEEELKIKPDLLSDDENFCNATRNHSALLWRIKKNKD